MDHYPNPSQPQHHALFQAHQQPQQSQHNIQTIRIAVVGDSGVGKSTLIRKLCYIKPELTNFFDFGANIDLCYHIHDPARFDPQGKDVSDTTSNTNNTHVDPNQTPQNNTTSSTIPFPQHELFIIEFVDIPGHKRYQETRESLFHNMDGVLLMFDARNQRSKTSVPRWCKELDVMNRQRGCFNVMFKSPDLHQLGPQQKQWVDDDPNLHGSDHTTAPPHHTLGQLFPNSHHLFNNINALAVSPQANHNHQSLVFPLFLIGTVVNGLQPLKFGWVDSIPFSDLIFVDINTVNEFVSSPNYGTSAHNHNTSHTNPLNPNAHDSFDPNPPNTVPPTPEDHPFVVLQELIGQFVDEIIVSKRTNPLQTASQLLNRPNNNSNGLVYNNPGGNSFNNPHLNMISPSSSNENTNTRNNANQRPPYKQFEHGDEDLMMMTNQRQPQPYQTAQPTQYVNNVRLNGNQAHLNTGLNTEFNHEALF